jgi:predicted porin
MNKKSAVALAVGAIFTLPALAQTSGSSVEIYGRLYPQFNWQKAKGASEPGDVTATLVAGDGGAGDHDARNSVDVNNSRIGFRGREQLGGGLSTIWQIEQRVRFDTGAGNTWAGARNNFVGLSGGFGTVKLGLMDTIFKEYGAVVGSFFGVSSGNVVASSAILPNHGLGLEGGTESDDTGFHIRAASTIQYETPEFGGFQAGIQYAPDEAKGNPGRGDLNTNLWSFGVKYEAGPIYASIQHERHNDWFDASASIEEATGVATSATSSKDTATRLSVGFSVTPQHKITGDIAQMEWKESGGVAGDFASYKKRTWAVGWEARWGGPWRTEITYTAGLEGDCSIVGADCDTDGLDGNMIAAGVAYSLSKRTLIYVLATRLENGDSAQFSNTANFDPNRGADTRTLSLGMSHSF